MASVWCAEDRVLGRSVAIKVLADRFAHDEHAVRRFMREARAAARVSNHPHVVTIYDVGDIEPEGENPSPRAFIVMEFLAGGTVADALRVDAVAPDEARQWVCQAASALDHAHQRGIVHRDIKPANFLLDPGRSLHVADFGIARLQSEDTITSTGELFGTAAYLAPEQALGNEATGASDRYALAVAAFELLTGGRPFTATHFAAQARQHIEDEPPLASERETSLPPAVDAVLARGMAKDPDERYPTARAFTEELDHALQSPPTVATQPLTARTRPLRPTSRRRDGAVAAGALAGAAAAEAAGEPAARAASIPPNRSTGGGGNDPGPRLGAGHPPAPRRGRALALTALAIVVLGVVALISQLNSSSTPSPAAHHHSVTAATNHARRRHRAPAKKRAPASSSSSTTGSASSSTPVSTPPAPAPASGAPGSGAPASGASALQAQGHQQMLSGDYQGAIGTLNRAVAAAPHSGLTYAYALYDLGRSLLLSGNPRAAIPILQQRLQIPNQTATVQGLLNQAEQAAGQSSASGGAALPGKDHGKAKGHGGG
jgi:serine/threonine-protein kinase